MTKPACAPTELPATQSAMADSKTMTNSQDELMNWMDQCTTEGQNERMAGYIQGLRIKFRHPLTLP